MNLLAKNIINSKTVRQSAGQNSEWTKIIIKKNEIVALIDLLYSRDPAAAEHAEKKLVKKGVEAVPYLILALHNEYDEDNPVSNTLVKIGTPALPYLLNELKVSKYSSRRIPEILIKINPYKSEIIKALIMSYDGYDSATNAEIAGILAEGGIKTLPYLKSALKSANPNARICASAAIKWMDPELTKGIIKDIVAAMGDKNDKVAHNMAYALIALGKSALPYALEARKNMKNDNMRLGSYKVLFCVLGQNSHKYVMEALSDTCPKIRAEAVWKLHIINEKYGHVPTEGIVDILINKMRDNDKEVRRAAVYFMIEITDWDDAKKAIEILTILRWGDRDAEIRRIARDALRNIKYKRENKVNELYPNE